MSRDKILIVIGLIAILGIAIFFAYTKLLVKTSPTSPSPLSSQTFKVEDVAFVSESDLEFQSKVKNITGYDWTQFLEATRDNKASVAALLFLANEIDSLDDDFAFVNRSVGLKKSELGITRLDASDASRENLMKLIGNIRSVEIVFLSKGLKSAQVRANRLSIIEGFFKKHELPKGEIVPDVKSIFAEKLVFSVDDYPKLVSLVIVNYNSFVAEK